ncbi:MAG: ABC transporter substrate-binding protein [Alphaproteobacteria bacterium]|nr:ABC transporter substrate-binding protein [Alphaproteobacteria bacterium]
MKDTLSLTRRRMLAASAGFTSLATLNLGEAQAAPVRGGKMIYARYADSLELDPVWTDANVDIWISSSIYETLLFPTADGLGVLPGLATKWAYSDGGKLLSLTLRPGVKFSDGAAMTAEDVKFSLDRARHPKNGAWNEMLGSIDSVEIASAEIVLLKLKRPDPTLLPALAMFNTGILPKAKYEATPGADDHAKAKAFAEKTLGTGPFMMTAWTRGQKMIFKRNPHYWGKDKDGVALPYLDEIEFQIIPDDATRMLKLKAGEVHGSEFIPFSRVKEMQADANLRMELWPSTAVSYVVLMCKETLKGGAKNPLADKKVRQALNYAVNKDAIITITTQGLGKPLQSFMSSVTPLNILGGPVYKYDPAKAKALLAEAGFAGGFEAKCMILAGNQNHTNDLTAIQQMLGQVGVKLTLEQLDNPSKTARYRAEDFQMNRGGWTDDIADPSEIASYFAYSPTVNNLHSGWKSDKVNDLFMQSQAENDITKRRAMYKEMQTIYIDEAPIIFLYETPYPVCWRKNVKGFVQIPLGNNFFEGAYVDKA